MKNPMALNRNDPPQLDTGLRGIPSAWETSCAGKAGKP